MNRALAGFQQSFVDNFLSPTASPWQILCAETGMGKLSTALEIIERVYQSDFTARILFVGSAFICRQVADILENRVSSPDPLYFSRQRIRELVETSNAPAWPTRIVAIANDVARQPDVLGRLRSIDWDFIVVDDSDRSVRSAQTLIPMLQPARVLLLTWRDYRPDEMPMFASTHTTHWGAEQLESAYKHNLRPVEFQRSDAELSIIKRVASLHAELKETEEARAFWRTVRRASMSSFNALEQSLTRQLALLNDPTAVVSRFSGMPEDFATRYAELPITNPWKDGVSAAEKLLSILEEIGKTNTDGKLAALTRLIDDITRQRPSYGLWILTSFRATAWYLNTALSERVSGVHVLTADMPYSRAVDVSDFSVRERSILVSTYASIQGLEFPGVTDVVFYDEVHARNLLTLVSSRIPVEPATELFEFLDGPETGSQFNKQSI
jgi:hypothetical protein